MATIAQRIYSFFTYGLVGLNFIVDFEFIKSLFLFLGALFLLILQIKIHWIKLRKEKGQTDYKNISWLDFFKNLLK